MDAVQKLHAFHEFLQVSSHNVPFYQQADELLAVQSKKNYLKMKFGLLGPKLCKAIYVWKMKEFPSAPTVCCAHKNNRRTILICEKKYLE